MLVTIQQTESNTENLFEVTSNSQLSSQTKAPWMKISLPFDAENLRELTFSNPAREIVYTARYRFIDNLVEELVPFKCLLTKGQRFGQFETISRNGNEGSFYIMQSSLFDSKFCVECMRDAYLGYSLNGGRDNYVSIYDDEKQIAQITKPLVVTDGLDVYFLRAKDKYTSVVPVLSFFTIYHDYWKYNHSGELTKNTVQTPNSYTYGKNNDRCNPSWIAKEFSRQAADELKQKLGKVREQGSAQVKKIAKLVGLAYLVLILLTIILFAVFKSILEWWGILS